MSTTFHRLLRDVANPLVDRRSSHWSRQATFPAGMLFAVTRALDPLEVKVRASYDLPPPEPKTTIQRAGRDGALRDPQQVQAILDNLSEGTTSNVTTATCAHMGYAVNPEHLLAQLVATDILSLEDIRAAAVTLYNMDEAGWEQLAQEQLR